jgi:DNA helicase-2/ATP-dependent DNA helicase PcrA
MPMSADGLKVYPLRPHPAAAPAGGFRIDYRAALNEAQYEAATTVDGPVLVVAGAGSGKTRTLVYRVAHLVERGVSPSAILLLTFTRRAAEEMLRRAGALVAGCERVAGGTFHSFANTTLRQYARALGMEPGFTILDRADSEDVINLLRSRMGFDTKERRFPRKRAIAEMFSMCVNRGEALADLLESGYPHLLEFDTELERLREAYVSYKVSRSLRDYDDLLLDLRRLLAERADLAQHLSARHRYIMVDEYQDTNHLQAEIVSLLGAAHNNVMAVGDDAQSIYSFRGADFRNIMDFPKMFPGTRILRLEENYRSTQPVLTLANEIIGHASEKYTKNLFTTRGGGELPALVQGADEQTQSRFVCQRILELREEGVPLDEMAVLFRSSYHSFDLELELQRYDLPFVKRGGFKFIETAHVKDVLAHLRVVVNPRDAVSWHRVLLLIDGVGPRSAEQVFDWIQGGDAAERLEAYPGRSKYVSELRRLAVLLRELDAEGRSPGDKMAHVVAHYVPLMRMIHREDYPKRERDLEHLATIAGRYRTLEGMLADMALEPPSDTVGNVLADTRAGGADDEGLLTLSTIHSAKGLEWRAVFIIWVVDGRFPPYFNLKSDAEMEEERRLLYVACTRAKDLLYLTYPIDVYDRASGVVLGRPSRFLEDVPPTVLEPIVAVESFGAEP